MIRLVLPRDLARLLGLPHHELECPDAPTLGELLRRTDAESAPGLFTRLVEADGTVREHINIFVGERNARTDGGLSVPLAAGDEVWVIRAVSGGSDRRAGRVGRPARGPSRHRSLQRLSARPSEARFTR